MLLLVVVLFLYYKSNNNNNDDLDYDDDDYYKQQWKVGTGNIKSWSADQTVCAHVGGKPDCMLTLYID